MEMLIGDIVEQVPVVNSQTISKEVDHIFQQNTRCEGIVVVNNNKPEGLIMRSQFYQKIGTQYGFNVYMGRSVKLIMSTFFLKVDVSKAISEVCIQAMNRPQEHLYDYVILTENDQYKGICSIRNLLITFAEVQAHAARDSNPLTGLPGNRRIDEELTRCLDYPAYTILYIDLDRFKEYNDTYGFNKGDQLIQKTAVILRDCLLQTEINSAFIGHIGGDDFIVCYEGHNYNELCQAIIDQFDQEIISFYKEEHVRDGFFKAMNRYGQDTKVPLTTISIAVINNQVTLYETIEDLTLEASVIKKRCKEKAYSCFMLALENSE